MAMSLRNGNRKPAIWNFIRGLCLNLVCGLRFSDLLAGIGIALLMSVVLVTHKFHVFPSYKAGDIAEADIRAPQEIWLEDEIATRIKREQASASVPFVFDYDGSSLPGALDGLRQAFAQGREILDGYAKRRNIRLAPTLSVQREVELWTEVRRALPDFPSERILIALFQNAFSSSLEEKLTSIFREVMQPGVVQSREALLRSQPNGIRIRSLQTGEESTLADIYQIRDVAQSRGMLRQRQLELAELNVLDRREVLAYLEGRIRPNLTPNPGETERRRQDTASRVETVQQHLKQGRIIVRQGDEVTPAALSAIEAIRRASQPREMAWRYLGIFLVIFMLLYAVWRYFSRFQSRHLKIRNHFLLFSFVLFLSLLISRLLISLADVISERMDMRALKDSVNLYYGIPFAFGCLLIALLVDTNIAILLMCLFASLIGIYTGSIYFACYVLLGGFAGIYAVKQYRDRSAILKAGLVIGLVNVLGAFAIDRLNPAAVNAEVLQVKLIAGFISGILAAMLASLFLPMLEWLFNITTDIRLLELSNLDSPVLRRMAVESPGTYHHSIIMGTLAEAAAEAIGANTLLVRAGAYYHDIGKLAKPQYFVENQIYVQNKHESLSPHMSALIISSHVKEGLETAAQLRLPTRIRDMIPQHHGTRVMTYFYQKARTDPRIQEQEIKEADFRYPGPKPQSKEAAILMIADAVEAASRTLTDPTPAQIQGMVKRLIDDIIADGQFDECDITLRELNLIAHSFLKILCGMFHHRIEYPGYDFNKTETSPAADEVAAHPGIQ